MARSTWGAEFAGFGSSFTRFCFMFGNGYVVLGLHFAPSRDFQPMLIDLCFINKIETYVIDGLGFAK